MIAFPVFFDFGRKRIPCPLDPQHTVVESELALHIKRCPAHRKQEEAEAKAYYRKACNTGSGPEVQLDEAAPGGPDAQGPDPKAGKSAAARLAHACGMGQARFLELAARVVAACEQVCGADEDPVEELLEELEALPGEGVASERSASNRPFSAKHARQQASIVGHLRRLGLLEEAQERAYVEFGAGKGYLGLAVREAAPGAALVLIDRGTFTLPADRVLRKMKARFERLRVDIADFEPRGAPLLLQGSGLGSSGKGPEPSLRPWIALGKHLCG
ncbi:hypothetical protein WJX81_003282 [Elliptochloris bilobata]|uniref:tRNA:m(4)X modification enzyme TRM13 n=1 Tax=Elliptochloris bilobata TaxID=381761 RepID=A0AAW1SJZ0_9CHLO